MLLVFLLMYCLVARDTRLFSNRLALTLSQHPSSRYRHTDSYDSAKKNKNKNLISILTVRSFCPLSPKTSHKHHQFRPTVNITLFIL